MRELQYKKFSLQTHKNNSQLKRPNVCQFELTFRCGIHCKHCYTDCYNKPNYAQKELKTKEVKFILDKVYKAGAIWLCFTGGDPLIRNDFLDIYAYAKDKGFLISIFTSAYSMSDEIAIYLKKRPPFVIEMTLNSVTKDLYENMSQVKGSFDRVMQKISLISKAKLPLKIKTQVTKDNLSQLPMIKKFIENRGLKFYPNYDLHARLNGDLAPCNLRIPLQRDSNLNRKKKQLDNDCQLSVQVAPDTLNANLFRCAVGGGDSINLDPYGNMFLCNLIRRPYFNLLKAEIKDAFGSLLPLVRNAVFTTESKCKSCNIREECFWCPGKALVETGDREAPIEDFCRLAHLTVKEPVKEG